MKLVVNAGHMVRHKPSVARMGSKRERWRDNFGFWNLDFGLVSALCGVTVR
jgi:hypothetical protein